MADLIHLSGDDAVQPDPDAIYVWAGLTGPMIGRLIQFRSNPKSMSDFSSGYWNIATAIALRTADETGIQKVYVVRAA
jgi:hypothetical protein